MGTFRVTKLWHVITWAKVKLRVPPYLFPFTKTIPDTEFASEREFLQISQNAFLSYNIFLHLVQAKHLLSSSVLPRVAQIISQMKAGGAGKLGFLYGPITEERSDQVYVLPMPGIWNLAYSRQAHIYMYLFLLLGCLAMKPY